MAMHSTNPFAVIQNWLRKLVFSFLPAGLAHPQDGWQVKFSLDGHDYLLLTAMPTTRLEHVWVTHDPQYKLSEHMQGASDDEAMFMVRRLSSLLEMPIHH
jgi:hypothetical protein